MSFNKFRQIAAAVGQQATGKLNISKFNAQPDELFLLARLTTSDSEYRISVDHDVQQAIWGGTKGLQWRNEFHATAMAVGILGVKVASSVSYFGAQAPIYYPDPNVFSAAAGSGVLTEAQALEGIYMGNHTFQTNESVRVDQVKTLGYRTVLQTQAASITTGFSGTTTAYTTQNMQIGEEFKYLGNVMKFVGGDDNYISFNLQCADKTNIAGTATRYNYLCVRLLGTVVKGGGTTKLRQG